MVYCKIAAGRVSVNGNVLSEVGKKVNAETDKILVDGKPIAIPQENEKVWIALHKPKGVLTTMKDELERDTILSLVPKGNDLRLIPVGGLDRDATGLQLLTNECGWVHPLTHASYRHAHEYAVEVEAEVGGALSEAALARLREGAVLLPARDPSGGTDSSYQMRRPPLTPGTASNARRGAGNGDKATAAAFRANSSSSSNSNSNRKEEEGQQRCPPASVEVLGADPERRRYQLRVLADEVRPRQVARMFEAERCRVVALKRLGFATVKLKSLPKGKWRELTQAEVRSLKLSCVKRGRPG
jgi:23S rRNA pseudouridine2605 synthase